MDLPLLDLTQFDTDSGRIPGFPLSERRLSDLGGCFADPAAYAAALAAGDPVVYSVSTVEPGQGAGDLHYGLGLIQPGRVGAEYYLTRGHLHAWREAAEIYIGLRGVGAMLLEDEDGGASKFLPFGPGSAVYVPGYTAHRTINTGDEPLVYLGIYPARAGHDYGALATRNFRDVVVAIGGRATCLARQTYLDTLRIEKAHAAKG